MASITAQQGVFALPNIVNEPCRNYEPGSADRTKLQQALKEMQQEAAQGKIHVPCIVNGKPIKTSSQAKQVNPSNFEEVLCTYDEADKGLINTAIKGALEARANWERMPLNDRAAIFLKAADLLANKYRYKIMAATMLGQGKNIWQAEIDAAAESCDFLRFGIKYMHQLYSIQPPENSAGVWNRVEYRPLEGFVLAVSPFNFTAIGINLAAAPAMVGNVVIWKPSPMAVYSNYLMLQILHEAGLPAGVIQFCPGPAGEVVSTALAHREFASLHFTGSTTIFKKLWKQIADNIENYRSYPRIVGETGGKNFHFVHSSANVEHAVHQTIRAAFEYQGQKCSALSRLYVPQSMWTNGGFKQLLSEQVSKISVGPVEEFQHFCGPVIAKTAFERITSMINEAKQAGGKIVCGGTSDGTKGFFVQPTVIETDDPKSVTMVNEIFGPVLTVYPYPDDQVDQTCALVDGTTDYSLTGAIFAQDRNALIHISNLLRDASGMMYFNDKCTGAVVGQQPFGGARGSGTNDRAGSMALLLRFTSARTIKESFNEIPHYIYPSNLS
ncbi:putative delta-1-pyrroline-5-carboxylate dehydrogenase [Meira miltonrushii]|uniref:Multifunctional fusion protein n=1 Tax=Meira miltonrushii TaxID=1280837 RepID=A0A316V940_9BASI|nr:putative delta-1-pyrroline-5-carboxylate dehydrogenase [Meira miltonrushii]PWN32703.1 putative delta-1-pyrroline-5-carboxylate dehydrogenase [Meira miltonrushii]